jgi:hypothetical protein
MNILQQGAAVGLIVGIGAVGWLAVGGQVMSDRGQTVFTPLPLSTEGCSMINETMSAGQSK